MNELPRIEKAIIHDVDIDRVSIQIGSSPNLYRNIEVGDASDLVPGQEVNIAWILGKPTILTGTIGGSAGGVVSTSNLSHSNLLDLDNDDHIQYASANNYGTRPAYIAERLNRRVEAGNGMAGGGLLVSSITLHLDTPGAISAGSINNAAGNHTHQVNASADPGAASSLLKTDATGLLDLEKANIGNFHLEGTSLASSSGITLDPASGLISADGNLMLTGASRTISTDSLLSLTLRPGGNLLLSPSGNQIIMPGSVTLKTENYISKLAGFGISGDGDAEFRSVYTDRLHSRTLVTEFERAISGSELITRSVGQLEDDYILPEFPFSNVMRVTAPGGRPMFADGDMIRLRQFAVTANGIEADDAWGRVYFTSMLLADMPDGSSEPLYLDGLYSFLYDENGDAIVDDDGNPILLDGSEDEYPSSDDYNLTTDGIENASLSNVQEYLFYRSEGVLGGTAFGVVPRGALVVDYGVPGDGLVEIDAIDAAGTPYVQIANWTEHPATGTVPRVRFGNLKGITGLEEYGLLAGDYFNKAYIIASDAGTELHGVDMTLWDGLDPTFRLRHDVPSLAMGKAVPSGYLNTSNGVWMGRDSDGTYRVRIGNASDGILAAGLAWDGTLLTVRGAIYVTGGSWSHSGDATLIDGGKIFTGSIVADAISANAITTEKIAAGAIQTQHMMANTIEGDRIKINTLSGNRIMAASIEAAKLNVTQLSAITANLGAITAGSLTAVSLTASTISGNTITGGTISSTQLSASSISGGTIHGTAITGSTIDVTSLSNTLARLRNDIDQLSDIVNATGGLYVDSFVYPSGGYIGDNYAQLAGGGLTIASGSGSYLDFTDGSYISSYSGSLLLAASNGRYISIGSNVNTNGNLYAAGVIQAAGGYYGGISGSGSSGPVTSISVSGGIVTGMSQTSGFTGTIDTFSSSQRYIYVYKGVITGYGSG